MSVIRPFCLGAGGGGGWAEAGSKHRVAGYIAQMHKAIEAGADVSLPDLQYRLHGS